MDDIFVARLMSTDLVTVTPDTLVEEGAQRMLEDGIGSLLVVNEDGEFEGILTNTDFVQIVAERKPKDRTPVSEYMSTDVVTASAQDSVREVADAIVEHGFHHMPVVDEDAGVIGIVTTTDLASYLSHVQRPSPT